MSRKRLVAFVCAVWCGGTGVVLAPSDAAAQTELSLEACIRIALDQSRAVKDADLNLDIANKQVREAWAGVYPKVDGLATYTRNLTDNEVFLPAIIFDPDAPPDELIAVNFSADNNWLASVTLDQPLFQAEIFIGVGAAKRFRALREEELRGRQQTTATRVRTAYYQFLLAKELEQVVQDSIRRVQTSLDETRAMNRAGLRSDYDVLRIDVELGNLTPNLRRAQNGVRAARRALNIAMGIEVEAPTEIIGRLRAVDLSALPGADPGQQAVLRVAGVDGTMDPETAFAIGERSRSDLRQIRLTEELGQAQLAAERASYYPRLFAFGSYQLLAQENGSPDFFGERRNDRTSNWQAGLRLEVPIFEGLGRPARVAQRQLAVERTRNSLIEAEENARNEIEAARDRLEEAALRAAAARRAVEQARRGFEIATIEFREGLGSQLQLTDSEVALRESEFNYAEAAYDYLTAQADLDLAVGRVPGVDDSELLEEPSNE